MAGGKLARAQHLLDAVREVEQAEGVGDVRPAFADGPRQLFLGVPELGHETMVALGFLHRVEILTLHVLDQSKFQRLSIAQLTDEYSYLVQLRFLGRAPAPFPRDNLVFPWLLGMRTHEDQIGRASCRGRVEK